MTPDVAVAVESVAPHPVPAQAHHRAFDDVVIAGRENGDGNAGTAPATGQAAEIADEVINLIRTYQYLKTRIASVLDPEVASLFLLVRLVKGGPKRAKELSEVMCTDQSTVSRHVAGLVKAGLVERKADPDDGRASILVPTDEGIERVQEHFVNRGQAIEPLIADWPDTDRVHLLRLLHKYNTALDARREEVLGVMTGAHALQQSTHHSSPHYRIERSY